ncbi:HEAT repeat domain-containing protein [Pyxidicoccus fallax]|uniref:HEAT repeat domain-containing protein n=1 Tax=Pyxidicoccus fallax TaxID=394095 RepID=A0A848LU45_9BACT|nr:HEAT repeat domain-containing protein [Pyxidicoccus fallax]NMO21122.1 HEAT repeat domain-containing protein [Pyxidicoccus fallax]NPC82220.1 HEAT repeat domain-containing protein [Pyxidicoccus fallax]
MREDTALEAARRGARPDDLASLRRLDAALTWTGFRVEGKTVREWISGFASVRSRWFNAPDTVRHVTRAGLGAVPALVDALRARTLDVRPNEDTNIRAQCIEALGSIEPLPTCAIPALLGALSLPSARVRWMSLTVLERMRPRPSTAALRALLPCLQDRNDTELRSRALRVLAAMEGALPEAVRRAALERLVDPKRVVRRDALPLLGRFANDPEVLIALEEQALIDDGNRIESLRVLADAAPERALPLLLDTARKAVEDRPRRQDLMNAQAMDHFWHEAGLRALLILGQMGARAASALPALSELTYVSRLAPHVDAAIDDIVRDLLRRRAPPLPVERLGDPRAVALVRDLPLLEDASEEPAKVLARWAADLRAFGPELTVRVALAAARRVLGLWEWQHPRHEGPRSALMAMERWLCAPADEHARGAVSHGDVVPSQAATSPDAFSAAWSVTYATLCLPGFDSSQHNLLGEDEGGSLGSCVYAACRALSRESVITWALGSSEESPTPLPPRQSAREIHQAILDEVLPWLCGTWDPVKDVPKLRDELRARSWEDR